MNLPKDFLNEMQEILRDDYAQYLESANDEPFRGISVNRIKTTPEQLLPLLPFETKKSPFYSDGYYIPSDEQGVGSLALHHAGAFYVQEPSATSAVELLDVQQGDRVLDLCAAPGGKSSQIASKLNGTGLIWSNEVVKNRAQILLSNFERMGIANGVVSSCYPEVLCERLNGFFDKVLVDAPCSGEGMFRKNPDAVTEWSREHAEACANRQLSILDSACECVREGGILVYSTCTFSFVENEEVVEQFLQKHTDFEMCDIPEHYGRATRLSCAVRITPIEGGEGHFAAKLRRKGNGAVPQYSTTVNRNQKNSGDYQTAEKLLKDIFVKMPSGVLSINKDKVYLLPNGLPNTEQLGVIRAGVLVGEIRKNRIEPAHSLMMSAQKENLKRVLNLEKDDPRVREFLEGLEIDCEGDNGYTAVAYCGIIMGFGKCSNSRLKNKYPKGLRIQK